eukprot:6151563-Amphidinium_carterae.2
MQWIGIRITVDWAGGLVPPKYIAEVCQEISSVLDSSMFGVRRLRSLAGRLAWAAGVLPHGRRA